MNDFNVEELKQFVIDSVSSSYAAGDAAKKIKETDGSTAIVFERGRYKLHDNYFGGEPYGGREVIFLDGKPVWMMVYYGLVYEGVEIKTTYAILTKALMNAPADFPFRGPKLFVEGMWHYENSWEGGTERFSGTENIFAGEKCVYKASYIGGVIDRS